jgi:hypothetical protein
MKKLVLLVMCMWFINALAQDSCPVTKYVSIGLSMSNGDEFVNNAFNSIDVGFTKHDISMGMSFGRGNLNGIFKKGDELKNYFYEFKVSPSFPLGYISVNVILGVGGYFKRPNNFIEYGFGFSRSYKSFSYGLSVSNWDGLNYVSPSVTYNF